MSSAVLRQLIGWDRPPAHTGFRSFEPVFVFDLRVYWQNKKGIEALYQLSIDESSEEDLDGLIESLRGVLGTLEGYLKLRGTEGFRLRQIRQQMSVISNALESIKRGYAPGQMPPERERIELANQRLREVHHP